MFREPGIWSVIALGFRFGSWLWGVAGCRVFPAFTRLHTNIEIDSRANRGACIRPADERQ